jgi:hypothetical protein
LQPQIGGVVVGGVEGFALARPGTLASNTGDASRRSMAAGLARS